MTREQFLAWKVRRELRYEFDGLQPVAMTGGTVAHAIIRAIWPSSSVRRYIVLAQDEMASTWFESIDDDRGGYPLNADSVLRMTEIGIEIALTELYQDVEFPAPGSVPQSH